MRLLVNLRIFFYRRSLYDLLEWVFHENRLSALGSEGGGEEEVEVVHIVGRVHGDRHYYCL